MTVVLVYFMTTVLAGADVSCAEATHHWDEVEAVMQVAHNRTQDGQSLLQHLCNPHQFAHNCDKSRLRIRHFIAATRAFVGRNAVPKWLKNRDIRWFCTTDAAWKWRQPDHWSQRRALRPAGRMRHVYWSGRRVR